jgi:chromosome partitioning protein
VILALVGQKGGAGKSTIAILVAAELAARGRRVLLVDADPQGTARTWGAVRAERGVDGGPSVVAMTGLLHRPEGVPRLASGFDDVVIDCPPRLADVQRSALVVADIAILPCGPTSADTWALAESLKPIAEVAELRPLKSAIVLNRVRAGTAAGRGAREALASAGAPILGTALGLRQAYAEAVGAGLSVGAYAPRDPAAEELRALANEVAGIADPAAAGVQKKARASGGKRG